MSIAMRHDDNDDRRPKISAAWQPTAAVSSSSSSPLRSVPLSVTAAQSSIAPLLVSSSNTMVTVTSMPAPGITVALTASPLLRPSQPSLASTAAAVASPTITGSRAYAYLYDTKQAATDGDTSANHPNRLPSPPMKAWHATSSLTAAVSSSLSSTIGEYAWPSGSGTRVLICVGVGSRGDVQPFLALALALQRTGRHRVIISVPTPFGDWIQSFGVRAIQHDIDLIARLRDTHGAEYRRISKWGQLKRSNDFWKPLITRFLEHYVDTRPDIVIAGSMSAMCSPLPCELLSIPYIIMHHTPHHPTKFFAPPIAPIDETSLGCINQAKWDVSEKAGWRAVWRDGINAIRAAQGRPIYQNKRGVEEFSRRDHIPVVYTYSQVLLPKPADWPDNEYVAGTMRMPSAADVTSTYVPSTALQSFIGNDTKDAPVYIGFGSMLSVYLSQQEMIAMISKLHRSLSLAGCRGIVCTTGCNVPPSSPSHILHVQDVSHDWLFPRCSVIVHHGGAGTTQSSLTAGRASIVIAFGFDQPFWARRIKHLGAGLYAGTIISFNERILAAMIRQVRSSTNMSHAATQLGNAMRNEDGTSVAISVIDRHMTDFTTGKLDAIMKFNITPSSSSCCTIM